MDSVVKPVVFVGSSLKDLQALPASARKSFGYALWQAQQGRQPRPAKPLKGFGGADVIELKADDQGSTYRTVYTVRFAEFIYVLHVFQKKAKQGVKTPAKEIELVRKRLRVAEEHYEKWKADKKKTRSV